MLVCVRVGNAGSPVTVFFFIPSSIRLPWDSSFLQPFPSHKLRFGNALLQWRTYGEVKMEIPIETLFDLLLFPIQDLLKQKHGESWPKRDRETLETRNLITKRG